MLFRSLVLADDKTKIKIYPTEEWKNTDLKNDESALFDKAVIEKWYYIGIKPGS